MLLPLPTTVPRTGPAATLLDVSRAEQGTPCRRGLALLETGRHRMQERRCLIISSASIYWLLLRSREPAFAVMRALGGADRENMTDLLCTYCVPCTYRVPGTTRFSSALELISHPGMQPLRTHFTVEQTEPEANLGALHLKARSCLGLGPLPGDHCSPPATLALPWVAWEHEVGAPPVRSPFLPGRAACSPPRGRFWHPRPASVLIRQPGLRWVLNALGGTKRCSHTHSLTRIMAGISIASIARSLLGTRPGAQSLTRSTARTPFCRRGTEAQRGTHLFRGSVGSYDTWVPRSPLTGT